MSQELLIRKLKEEKSYLKDSAVKIINKGWSKDRKYILTNKENKKYLITIFDIDNYKRKIHEYEIRDKMFSSGVKVPKTIEISHHNDFGYSISAFIEGEDGEDILGALSEEEQYNIGIQAGKELKITHQLNAPEDMKTWYERKKTKHDKYMCVYKESKKRLENEDLILEYINNNISLMKRRPNKFQHDDFHVGNIIINNKNLVGIIDFELFDFGDPIHEFIKVGLISKTTSVPFAVGQIHGYFNTKKPKESFWRLYSLYLAMSAVSTVVWLQRFHPERYDEGMEGINTMLCDHNYFRSIIPKWYLNANSKPYFRDEK